MPIDRKVDYIEFPARDLDAVQKFYETAFGWIFTDYGTEYKSFTDGKMNGGFYRAKLKSTTKNGAVLVVLFAENLEKTAKKVISSGGSIVKDIFSFPGGRRFHFADPNGNELAVWSDR
jgi:predicted enzyme related to lactoylglutathione lyase